MKRWTKSTQQKKAMEYYKGVPSDINKKFISKKVDAAFISSIASRKYLHVNLGIVAKKEVQSVLVVLDKETKKDSASATSNVLASLLGIDGEIIIGDKALRYYLQNDNYIDLAKEWHKRYRLPFVFAVLCYHKDKKIYKDIEKNFLKTNIKIPQYLLQKAEKRTQIAKKDILSYLKCISYDLDTKAKKSLKKFLKEAKCLQDS